MFLFVLYLSKYIVLFLLFILYSLVNIICMCMFTFMFILMFKFMFMFTFMLMFMFMIMIMFILHIKVRIKCIVNAHNKKLLIFMNFEKNVHLSNLDCTDGLLIFPPSLQFSRHSVEITKVGRVLLNSTSNIIKYFISFICCF